MEHSFIQRRTRPTAGLQDLNNLVLGLNGLILRNGELVHEPHHISAAKLLGSGRLLRTSSGGDLLR